MGQEDDEGDNNGDGKEEIPEIVLKIDMHCEACARKVKKALKGFEGVEDVSADSKASTVVVKGKRADPLKLSERLRKKSRRKVEIISPLPPPPPESSHEQEEKKEEAPSPTTVVLRIGMHCESCAQILQKRIRKIEGVDTVEADFGSSRVTVKGVVEPSKLVEDVYKRTKKQAVVVVDEGSSSTDDEARKEEKEDEEEEEEGKIEMKPREILVPARFFMEQAFAAQIFSEENPNACCAM